MAVVDVGDLHKLYGTVRAVDGLTFSIAQGEVYALLGENGAGKSTAVEILEGHRTATSGTVEVLGVDPSRGGRDFRDRIGIVLQSSGVEAEFTVREVIELYGGCYRNPRSLDEVVSLVGLDEKVDARVGSLSGGQRRRVDLALGIVGRPELLFLDEPTTGFDPSARRRSWDLIEALGDDGTTVLLTTHYLDEAEHLADRVGVLSRGRLIAEGSPGELIDQVSGTIVSFMLPDSVHPDAAMTTFGELLGVEIRLSGRLVEASIEQPTAAVHRITGMGPRDRRRARVALGESGVARRRLSLAHRPHRSGRADRGAWAVSGFPSTPRLLVAQTRYQIVTFVRIPVAVFFTLGLPLVMLVLFNALFGDNTFETADGGQLSAQQFYTGGLAAFTAVSATFTNLANMVPIRRDEGVLKRWRGTPLPTWIYLAGFILSAVLIAVVGVVLMLTLGVVVYDLEIEAAKMPAAIATFLIGVGAFAALGMALAAVVKSASSASAAANAIILPMAFVSNIFIQVDDAPVWITALGDFFPLKHFAESFQDCFTPFVEAPAFDWLSMAYVALWGVAGLVVAMRFFTWEPSRSAPRSRRSRRSAAATTD